MLSKYTKPYQIYIVREGNSCGAGWGYLLPEKFMIKKEAMAAIAKYRKENPRHIAWLSEN